MVITHIKAGANADLTDSDGWTPLHYAATVENATICSLLVEHEAQVESKNSSGETPLHIAVMKGNVPAMQGLLQNGAKMTTKDNTDKTPISKLALAGKKLMFLLGENFFEQIHHKKFFTLRYIYIYFHPLVFVPRKNISRWEIFSNKFTLNIYMLL